MNHLKLWEARSRLYRSQILQINKKYSLESSWRDLQYLHAFAPWGSNLKTKKNASCFCTAQHSKFQPNFVKRFRTFTFLFQKVTDFFDFFPKSCVKFTNFYENYPEWFQPFLRKLPDYVRFSNFPVNSQRKLSNFQKMSFQPLEEVIKRMT